MSVDRPNINALIEQPWERAAESKRWRIYFNKREAFPHIWSVDEGTSDSEILVKWFTINNAFQGSSGHNLYPTSGQNQYVDPNGPCAWIEIVARAVFENGGVTFYGRS